MIFLLFLHRKGFFFRFAVVEYAQEMPMYKEKNHAEKMDNCCIDADADAFDDGRL